MRAGRGGPAVAAVRVTGNGVAALAQVAGGGDAHRRDDPRGRRGAAGSPSGAPGAGAAAVRRPERGAAAPRGTATARTGARRAPALPAVSARLRRAGSGLEELPGPRPALTPVAELSLSKRFFHSLPALQKSLLHLAYFPLHCPSSDGTQLRAARCIGMECRCLCSRNRKEAAKVLNVSFKIVSGYHYANSKANCQKQRRKNVPVVC